MKHSKMYKVYVLCIFLLSCIEVHAQQTILKGLVVDDYGAPISWATVTLKGKWMYGTTSDNTGHFIMPIDLQSDTLIKCTRVGFEDYSQKIYRNNYLVIALRHRVNHFRLPALSDTIVYEKKKLPHIELTPGDKYWDSIFNNEKERIFTRVEVESEFAGGTNAIYDYIKANLEFSDSASSANTKGLVRVGFVVAEDGAVKNVNIMSGINKYYDQAILNVIKKMPKWRPAIQNGRLVSSYKEMDIPINIEIQTR